MSKDNAAGHWNLPELFFARTRDSAAGEALQYKKDGRWLSITWTDYEKRVRELARAIADWIRPGDVAGIFSENRPEWCIADLAVLSLAGVTVPIYPSSLPKDAAYILEDCGAKLLFVSSAAHLETILALQRDGRMPQLERVVVFDPLEPTADWVLSLESLLRRNAGLPDPIPERLAGMKQEDLATIIYTSGTTGEPKGVMLSHRNIVSTVLGGHIVVDVLDLPKKKMLSFLPLAHALERSIGFYVAVHFGFTVAFAESVAKLSDNLREVQPTVLVSVPRIYEKVYARMQESAGKGLKGHLFSWALGVGRRYLPYRLQGRPAPLILKLQNKVADKLVFSKVRNLLGGQLRYAISGGAPLAKELGEVFGAIGLTVFEGYGLTESSPILSANRPDAIRFGSVGKAWPGVEIRIQPEPGREAEGEILARGPNIMLGYHHKPAATAQALDAEGWLHTGDIGFFDPDGFLHVTDRKKDLIKTSGGKYVAPQPIENKLKLNPLVDQAVVIGDRRKYCVALLAPRLETLSRILDRPLPADRRELNQDPEVGKLYQDMLDDLNKDLGSWEQIKRVYLLPNELSQEAGELTPTLKVKRKVIAEEFKEIIDSLYAAP